ncbi:MAG: GNAT family N-acetyltransferase [Acidobacteria bacterium]|nr:GNAT family N-acetyltransferase [Acidobacteriota bacterium]
MSEISIRKAGLQDNERLAQLGARTFADTYRERNTVEDLSAYLAAHFSPAIQMAELLDPNTIYLLAEVNGTAVGFVRLLSGTAPEEVPATQPIQMVRIYADHTWIGHGVGAALMQASLQAAREKGCDGMWLGVWEENQRAIQFYARWGFEKVGNQTFVLGTDHQNDWVMYRSLSEHT